jgi:hypothetical protein
MPDGRLRQVINHSRGATKEVSSGCLQIEEREEQPEGNCLILELRIFGGYRRLAAA